ncbi:sigma-70 family RNA polymerase sigma factor [Candidatus Poribacteria bacterium]|nr:sigma-70 family RNA polymerase sigma factor [Candidatus Poribacteria bacterium]
MDANIHNDAELVMRVWQGNTEAFDMLFKKYQRNLHYLVRGWVSNLQDAEDCCQEALIKVYAAMRDRKEPRQPENFWPYLKTIAYNTSMDLHRSHGKFPIILELTEKLKIADNSNPIDETEMQEIVENMIDKLPKKEALVIRMYYLEGKGVDEISEILNFGQPWVSKRKKRGEKLLKKLFKNSEIGGE